MAKSNSTTNKKVGNKPAKSSTNKKAVKSEASAAGGTSGGAKKKSKAGLIGGLIVALALIIIGVIALVANLNKPDPADPTAKLDYSESFFVYGDGKYSLWNAKGERLSEEEYQFQSNFVGGYAMVKKDDQYGIIDENGKMSVDYGKYSYITDKGGLFSATDVESEDEYLLTGSGKVLEKGEDIEVITATPSAGFAAVVTQDKVKVYNYAGTLMIETDKLGDDETPELGAMNNIGVMYYGDKNWVFDARDGRVIATLDGDKYGIDDVSDDRSLVILYEYNDKKDYKLIKDGKVYDLNETKNYGVTTTNQVMGFDDYDELALLGDDYKVIRRVSSVVQLKDENNFAEEKEDGGVVIYRNGAVVKEFGEDSSLPVSALVYDNYYAIDDGDKIQFYNLDGTVAFDKVFEDVSELSGENHYAIVAERDDEYYLMDARGNKVGEVVAYDIDYSSGGYKFMDENGKYAIFDKDGNQVTDFKYKDLYYRSLTKPRNIWTAKLEDGTVDVIDVDNKRVLLEGVTIDNFYEHYFTIKKDDGNIEYYTLDGKPFFTRKK